VDHGDPKLVLKAPAAVWHNQAIPYDAEFFLNGNLRELDRLADEIGRFCTTHSLGDDAVFELNLVLEELFVNSVRHGGCEGMDQAAHVRLRVADCVEVEYRDRGRAFDPTQAPEPDIHAPLEERKTGGLGIHLMRKIMRTVEYARVGDENQINMTWGAL
jgi:anti-sigma regulatory factor (Ser/Thr protein kinase)